MNSCFSISSLVSCSSRSMYMSIMSLSTPHVSSLRIFRSRASSWVRVHVMAHRHSIYVVNKKGGGGDWKKNEEKDWLGCCCF